MMITHTCFTISVGTFIDIVLTAANTWTYTHTHTLAHAAISSGRDEVFDSSLSGAQPLSIKPDPRTLAAASCAVN